ncbi:adenylate kinase [Gordonia sp. 852002-50816_SCH5313054-c]|uniref:adenylate kinase n=1 Tax=unclassified Gordonia (in: high G+C Gram-positive bacteria) TaxID=2657482 RepID=UPI0007EB5FD9|nr:MULTISPECIES: adenylate kinase [unclassified Gordonia (in: high G+C Gram-positive bacteria)]OBC04036.1 adenylate kinase [Gordonia sp. 852002-50816_SCH5313054-a]OBC12675.1 adenylate kinase [Gordonia sp. 852002-50816_SCH5313054-c]
MRLVFLGPPGAGKGTQAELLSETLGIPHISTGDLFRANISEGTAIGIEAKKYLDAGDLVPPEITVDMVRARLSEPDASKGFILDGFPRSIEQAEALNSILADLDTELDAVVSFVVDPDVVVDRMLARGRADDTEDVIRNRMAVYDKETAPLLEYYGDQVKTVDAVGEVDEVHQRVLSALGVKVS